MNDETNNDSYRQLLIDKYAQIYTSSFSSKEIIDLLVLTVCPRKNYKKIAKRLIEHFGQDFTKIIDAPTQELIKIAGLSPQTAEFIHMIPKITRTYMQDLKNRKDILKQSNIESYALNLLLHRKEEVFYLVSLNRISKIVAENIISRGSATSVIVNLRDLSKAIINSHAYAVLLVHNHPGGDVTPSEEDIELTEFLVRYIKNLNVITIDHIIVNDKKFYSMRKNKPYIFLEE